VMMRWPIIGVNLPRNTSFASLDATLSAMVDQGFDAVEITLDTFPVIIGARVCQRWVDVLKPVLVHHPLVYTAHIGRGLDLRDQSDPALHKDVLLSSLEVCHQLGIELLVLHYEVTSGDTRIEEQFLEAHRWAADRAEELHVKICVENIEVELVEPLVAFIERAAHPQLALTLDTGHAYLAARYFGFDFLTAVSAMAPYLGHLHLNDNTGTFEELRITDRVAYDAMTMGWRREFGKGDIHLPPFYGTLPFDEVLALLDGYHGIYLCEYTYGDFAPLNQSIQETVRRHIIASRTACGEP